MRTSLSIIVPCLNEADVIVNTLDALHGLRMRGAEVIVVDGGSADGTPALARPHADRVIESRRGRGLQMNAGAAAAGGDVLLFLHADSNVPANADMLIGEGLARQDSTWGRFDVCIAGSHPMLALIATCMNARSRLTGIATGDQAIFVTRTQFQAVGGYREIALMEDIDVSARLKRISRPLCLREKVTTSGRRWDRNGVARTILLMWRLRLAYWLGADPARLALRYGTGK